MKLPIQGRKKYVITLDKRGYTIRQIAVELHMSTRDYFHQRDQKHCNYIKKEQIF